MTDEDTTEDERGLMARLLRKSADEIEQKADDEDGDDDDEGGTEEKATPIDSALENGTITAAQATDLRPVAEKMDDDGVQTLVDAISENDLDVEEAVDMIEAVDAGDVPDPTDDDGGEAPEELKSAADGDDPSDDVDEDELDAAVEKLESKLEAAEEATERLDEIEQKLEDLEEDLTTDEDIEQKLEQKLDGLAEDLDDEFEELLQKADVVDSPTPTAGEGDDDQTLGDVVRLGGD